MNYDPDCVYYTSFVFDAFLFLVWGLYALGLLGTYSKSWPHYVFLIFALALMVMGIFALIQIFTKNSTAPSRHANYVKYRMWTIYGLIIAGIIVLALWLIYGFAGGYAAGWVIGAAISACFPFFFDAGILHGYHANFQ